MGYLQQSIQQFWWFFMWSGLCLCLSLTWPEISFKRKILLFFTGTWVVMIIFKLTFNTSGYLESLLQITEGTAKIEGFQKLGLLLHSALMYQIGMADLLVRTKNGGYLVHDYLDRLKTVFIFISLVTIIWFILNSILNHLIYYLIPLVIVYFLSTPLSNKWSKTLIILGLFFHLLTYHQWL